MSGVGRRIVTSLKSLEANDFETSATAVFQAVDATGRKRFPNAGIGARFMGLIDEQHDIISAVAINNIIIGAEFEGFTFPKAIWKFWPKPIDS